MAQFKEAYLLGRDDEGGYANIAGDKGGETYAGISRVNFPTWPGWVIIDAIKKNRKIKYNEKIDNPILEGHVFNFYEQEFWKKKIKGDQIIDQQVANQIYNWVLTSGKAIMKIQEALHLTADGVIGPNTLKVINAANPETLFNLIKEVRIAYYKQIGVGTNAQFLDGWLKRANRFVYKK